MEINTQPGMTNLSLVPEIANHAGLSFENLVEKIILEIITKTKAHNMKDMGKVMGMASGQLAGRADGKLIARLVKQNLGV